MKFRDRNGNGVYDTGDEPLSGWTIHLYGTDGLGNAVDLTDTTDASGQYSFLVNPGSCTVCKRPPADGMTWAQTAPALGTGTVLCSDPDCGVGYAITLQPGDFTYCDTDEDSAHYSGLYWAFTPGPGRTIQSTDTMLKALSYRGGRGAPRVSPRPCCGPPPPSC